MAVAPASPARPLQGRHPLCPPLVPQLRLHPHRDLSAHRGFPGRRGNEADPRDQAHGLRPHDRRRDDPAKLPDNRAEQPLRLLMAGGPGEVGHPCFGTGLDVAVEVLATLPQFPAM